MKSVAIFTWHNGDCNCGQTLQAYALQKKLECIGYQSVIVDYVYLGKDIYHNKYIWPIYRLYDTLRNHRIIKQTKFRSFIKKNLHVTKRVFTFSEIENVLRSEEIDNYLLGSDQIWNPQAGNIPRAMLLDFPGGVKCSYSPSMCEENDFSKYKDEIYKVHEAIKDFKYVGVRESNAKRMIELFGKDKPIKVVLDPVFLFDMKEWIKLLEIETTEEGYVLVYCLGLLSDEIIECIQKISVNKKVFFVVVNRLNECHKEWNKVVNVDPIDFVRLVYGADYIVCDSFHMVAFSIIFRKQFSVFTCHRREFKSNMDRITNLLERVHLEKRFDNVFSVDEYIDYSQYNDCIEEEIKKSKDFLSNLVGAFK